jgi:hypothetical protein
MPSPSSATMKKSRPPKRKMSPSSSSITAKKPRPSKRKSDTARSFPAPDPRGNLPFYDYSQNYIPTTIMNDSVLHRDDTITFDLLQQQGYIVLPFIDPRYMHQVQQAFDHVVFNQLDLQLQEPPFVGGGFSALANPYSFHNDFVRDARVLYHTFITPPARMLFSRPGTNIEIYPDRMSFREKKVKPTKESGHRDCTPMDTPLQGVQAKRGDRIFGGWINFNHSLTQHFHCIPYTHTQVDGAAIVGANGFTSIDPSDPALQTAFSVIDIPPGHLLIFDQRLVHQVRAVAEKTQSIRRLYTAFRITSSDEPMNNAMVQLLQNGDVIPLKSGQLPRMYPHLWHCQEARLGLIAKFTSRVPACMKSSSGTLMPVAHSLKDMGIPFRKYTDTEIGMYLPHPL